MACRKQFLALGAVPLSMISTTPTLADDRPDRYVAIGAGVGAVPRFQGSDESKVIALPLIDARYERFFLNSDNGIGIYVVDDSAVSIGASVDFVRGYRRRDVPSGIERVKDSAGARLFARLRAGRASIEMGATKVLGGAKGVLVDARIAYELPLSANVTLTPSLAASWANGRHMNGYFGVDPAEARASGLPGFKAGQGIKDASAMIAARYRLGRHWNLVAGGGVTGLFSDALDSPLNRRRWNPTGFAGLTYLF